MNLLTLEYAWLLLYLWPLLSVLYVLSIPKVDTRSHRQVSLFFIVIQALLSFKWLPSDSLSFYLCLFSSFVFVLILLFFKKSIEQKGYTVIVVLWFAYIATLWSYMVHDKMHALSLMHVTLWVIAYGIALLGVGLKGRFLMRFLLVAICVDTLSLILVYLSVQQFQLCLWAPFLLRLLFPFILGGSLMRVMTRELAVAWLFFVLVQAFFIAELWQHIEGVL